MPSRTASWFSCGAASAVATKLTSPDVIAYCETGSEHPDNRRFLIDCEKWFGKEVTILQNPDFRDTWDVWEKRKYISGINGAPCTGALKIAPRLAFQRPDDPNANCLPCCKATSPAHWALVRKHFPSRFGRMATLSRELGARLARVDNERVFIDEVPAEQSTADPIAPECDMLCALAEQELANTTRHNDPQTG